VRTRSLAHSSSEGLFNSFLPPVTGFWTLDPIDGTKGFLRGGQYAVCLALLIDARVELGVIGCPNLPHAIASNPNPNPNTSADHPSPEHARVDDERAKKGALFVAVRGHGAYQLPLFVSPTPSTPVPVSPAPWQRLSMPRLALHELSFLESVERAHAALDTHAHVAARLGVRAEPVRMDSQVKYAALARGEGGSGVYMRLPVARHGGSGGGYQEKIWVRIYAHARHTSRLCRSIANTFVFLSLLCRITRQGRSW